MTNHAEPVTCDIYEGKGKIGCSNFCETSALTREICERNHTCQFCKGEGKLTYALTDWKDSKAPLHLLGYRGHKAGSEARN